MTVKNGYLKAISLRPKTITDNYSIYIILENTIYKEIKWAKRPTRADLTDLLKKYKEDIEDGD